MACKRRQDSFWFGIAIGAGIGSVLTVALNCIRRRQYFRDARRRSHSRLISRRDYFDIKSDKKSVPPIYPPTHWCRTVMPATSERFIAVLKVTDDSACSREVLVLLKSAEGYATVCALTDRKNPTQIFNRVPSQQEYEAVSMAASQVAAAFLRLGIYPQMELLGNNSHYFNEAKGVLELGNTKEPYSPHFHVYGRGDPKHEYVKGVPLRGSTPYKVMIPRNRAEKFEKGEAVKVAIALAQSLSSVQLHPSVKIVEKKVILSS
eukprot:jgi/Bigna1/46066/estExt_Genewise1.C_10474